MGNGCEHVDKGASASSAALYCLCTVLKRGASAPCAFARLYRAPGRVGKTSAGEFSVVAISLIRVEYTPVLRSPREYISLKE